MEIDDDDFGYQVQTDLGPYPELEGGEDENKIKCKETGHKFKNTDYQKYLGVQEDFHHEMQTCMDPTWMAPLKRPQGGFAHVTIKRFLEHL